MLRRLLFSAALIAAAASCGEEPTTHSQDVAAPSPAAPAPPPQSESSASYVFWGDTREGVCAHMREEIAAGRPQAEGELSERPYEPGYLPGFVAPTLSPASAAAVQRIYGQPCEGIAHVYAAPISVFENGEDDARATFAAILRPMVLRLPGGRDVVLAPVIPGDSHATDGFYAASILGGDQRRPFAMDGGGTFGRPGTLSVPAEQPTGAFHVWLEGGGTWQGNTQGWAAITDFSGAAPRARGSFPTRGDFACEREREGEPCRGAVQYALTSIRHSDNGPDQLTLVWTLRTFDLYARDRRANQTQRTLTARYVLSGGTYSRVEGEEPPRL